MISSNAYDYINVLDKAADASWLRNEAIANNIANIDTPDYKRQDVDFQSALSMALSDSKYITMDSKVANITSSQLNVGVYTDYGDFSYRLDGNNVDVDTENVELASNQIYYQAIMECVNAEFKNLTTAMK